MKCLKCLKVCLASLRSQWHQKFFFPFWSPVPFSPLSTYFSHFYGREALGSSNYFCLYLIHGPHPVMSQCSSAKPAFKPLLHMYVEHVTTEDKDKRTYCCFILLCVTHCSPTPFPPRPSTVFNPNTVKQKNQTKSKRNKWKFMKSLLSPLRKYLHNLGLARYNFCFSVLQIEQEYCTCLTSKWSRTELLPSPRVLKTWYQKKKSI
jgi:hypothetical protein